MAASTSLFQSTLPSLIEACRRLITPERRRVIEQRGARLAEQSRQAYEQAVEQAAWGWDASPVSTARLSVELWNQIKDEDWDRILELNFSSCMAMSRALVPQMKERRWGRIIHISSIMALGSKEQRHAYSGTKAALIGMCRAMAIELGPYNITVNCINPGPFLTDLPGTLLSDAEKKTFADRTALGRWADPKELAGPALLLASEAGSYITGTTLVVDGGTLCKTF